MLRATLLIIIIFSTLITLHPPRICRLAVFSIKPTLLSLPFAVIWAGSGHEYHSFHASHLLRSNAPVGSFSFSLSSLPFFVSWGGGVSFVGPRSPIRSLGRLPVGLGSLNKIPLPHLYSPSPLIVINIIIIITTPILIIPREVAVTSSSPNPFVSPRGNFNTNQRLSQHAAMRQREVVS